MSQTEDELYNDKARGERAAQLASDPIIVAAFAVLRDKYQEAFFASKPDEAEGRERLHAAYSVLGEVENHFLTVIGNGKIASQAIEQLKKRK